MTNSYSKMQMNSYEAEASTWSLTNRDPVVGSFDQHNSWADYDNYLFSGVSTEGKIALDFGCGPGRNIVKFDSWFERIDGIDISSKNLDNARIWLEANMISKPKIRLFQSSGDDLATAR